MHELPIVKLYGFNFDLSSIIMILVTCIIVFVIARLGVRSLSVTNPGKMQNFLEWVVEFVHNLISSTMDMKKGKKFIMLGLTLIMFIFVGNMLGLPFSIVTEHHEPFSLFGLDIVTQQDLDAQHAKGGNGEAHQSVHLLWWKSPTADASVTMGLALMVIIMSHFLGLTQNTRNYLKHYIEPHPAMFPLNAIKEVSKLLTLGLRLFGNIYAGEVLISVILMTGAFGIPALLVWQGFSMFVGAIQAFVFTILSMVYLSQAIEHEH